MQVFATDMFPHFRQFLLGASQYPKPRYTLESILPTERDATIRIPVQKCEGLENDRHGRVNLGPMPSEASPQTNEPGAVSRYCHRTAATVRAHLGHGPSCFPSSDLSAAKLDSNVTLSGRQESSQVGPRRNSSLVQWVAGKSQRDPCPAIDEDRLSVSHQTSS